MDTLMVWRLIDCLRNPLSECPLPMDLNLLLFPISHREGGKPMSVEWILSCIECTDEHYLILRSFLNQF